MPAFTLPTELADQITALAVALESYVTQARDEWADRSERWQEGEDGVAADGWLEEIEQVSDALTSLPTSPE